MQNVLFSFSAISGTKLVTSMAEGEPFDLTILLVYNQNSHVHAGESVKLIIIGFIHITLDDPPKFPVQAVNTN